MNKQIVNNIVENIEIEKNEVVLLHFWGGDKYKNVLSMFSKSVIACGGIPFEYQNFLYEYKEIFENSKNGIPDKYYKCFETIDIVIDIFVEPLPDTQHIDKGILELKRDYLSKIFQILRNKRKIIQIRMATVENANQAGIESTFYINSMNMAFSVDCKLLKKDCEEYISNNLQKNQIILSTYDLNGKQYELFLNTTERKWHIDAGDGDWPCGEIYIAPNEEKTNGEIYFSNVYLENGKEFENVRLVIQKGELINSNNKFFLEEIQSITHERVILCELGFGMNPNVSKITKYAVLDEKAKGTFHIGFGDNTMFGGENKAQFHFDLINEGKWIIK